jgi:hypothetical protein
MIKDGLLQKLVPQKDVEPALLDLFIIVRRAKDHETSPP